MRFCFFAVKCKSMSWSKVLLFGDSITQQSFSINGRWGALLADRFQRIADVITRGFSGYNTRWCKIIFPQVLESFSAKDISCVTIFLGANDCSLPTSEQYVPLDEYQQNLEEMILMLENHNIERHKVILITPPIYFQSKFEISCYEEGLPKPLRSNERPKMYAQAMSELGTKLDVAVIDVYSAFVDDGRGEELLRDGLHFAPAGAELFYDLVVKEIECRVLAFRGESVTTETMNYQHWKNVDTSNLEHSLFNRSVSK